METLLMILDTLFIRIFTLDKSKKEDVSQETFEKACKVLLAVAIWAIICFLVLYVLVDWNGLSCVLLFFVGWGLIALFGQRYLRQVEDPQKKRYYLYGLLFPKDPPKK